MLYMFKTLVPLLSGHALYNYMRYYKVLPKLLHRPNTGIERVRLYSSTINKAVWKILIM
jgi:hypothetical protein